MSARQTFRNTLVVILTLVVAYALYASARILVVLLVAIIVASAVRPSVLWLEKRHIPEGLAILLVYAGIAFGIFLLSVVVLPPAARQFAGYIENDNNLADRIIESQTWIQNTIQERTGTYITLFDPDALRTTISDVI